MDTFWRSGLIFLFAKQTKPSKRRTTAYVLFQFLAIKRLLLTWFLRGFCFDIDYFAACTGFVSDECNSFS